MKVRNTSPEGSPRRCRGAVAALALTLATASCGRSEVDAASETSTELTDEVAETGAAPRNPGAVAETSWFESGEMGEEGRSTRATARPPLAIEERLHIDHGDLSQALAAYGASKAAVRAFDEALGREARRRKIRVIDARPPHTETGLATRALAGQAPRMPVGLDPAQVADTICAAIAGDQVDLPSGAFGS